MDKKIKATITGLGAYLPERILTNSDLEAMVETSNEWIVTRCGIEERRIARADEFSSTMGARAAQTAMQQAKITANEIDAIIVCSMTPDYLCPSTAALIQNELQATRACAIDIQAACSGFLYGLSIAKAWIDSTVFKNILVIATEKNSAYIDYKDRGTCILFGDGAGAAVVQKGGPGYAIDYVSIGADGSEANLIVIPASGCRMPASEETVKNGDHFLKMNGKEVFKHAVRRMEAAAKECLDKTGISQEELGWLIPHQANLRIMEAISKRFQIPWERVYRTIHKYGNTSSSTVPIALAEFDAEKAAKHNEHLLLVAFGGGLTWGASLLTKVDA
ncbi:MAG: fabH [Chlamydiia bacterium]|nr:fabH [Chlamydiia bacterium]